MSRTVTFRPVSLPNLMDQEKEKGIALVKEMIESHMAEINVQPPTPQSLAVAAEVGIEFGRSLASHNTPAQYVGNYALKAANQYVRTELFAVPRDENFSTLLEAANEALIASSFKHVHVDFGEEI